MVCRLKPQIGILLVLVLLLLGTQLSFGDQSSEVCNMNQNIMKMQLLCKEPNEALLNAELEKNTKKLCKQVILLLKCVAANMSVCYDDFHKLQEFYFVSPYYCKLTYKHIREIQSILKKSRRKKKAEKQAEKQKQLTTTTTTKHSLINYTNIPPIKETGFMPTITSSNSNQEHLKKSKQSKNNNNSSSSSSKNNKDNSNLNNIDNADKNSSSSGLNRVTLSPTHKGGGGYTVDEESEEEKKRKEEGTSEQHKGSNNSSCILRLSTLTYSLVAFLTVTSWSLKQ